MFTNKCQKKLLFLSISKCLFLLIISKKKNKWTKKECQEWDSNPCPFGPVPETGALDQLGHPDFVDVSFWMS